jgi:hypothetical protein
MQITLVQTEIELAIREYVGRVMRIADGMAMSIDLAATRGAEGFKATIDIVPTTMTTSVNKNLDTVVFRASASPTPITNRDTIKTDEPEKIKTDLAANEVVAAEPEEKDVPFETQQQESSDKPASVSEEGTTSTADQGNGSMIQAAPSTSRSLFGALKKPKN